MQYIKTANQRIAAAMNTLSAFDVRRFFSRATATLPPFTHHFLLLAVLSTINESTVTFR